MAGPDGTTYP